MEISKRELEVVQRAMNDNQGIEAVELQELQLALVGGGNATVDFG